MHGEPTSLDGGGEIERALASVEEALMNVKEALGSSEDTNTENDAFLDKSNTSSSNGPNSPAVGKAYISRYVLASTPSPKLARKVKDVSDSDDDDEEEDDEVVHFVIRRPSLPKKEEQSEISFNVNSDVIGQGAEAPACAKRECNDGEEEKVVAENGDGGVSGVISELIAGEKQSETKESFEVANSSEVSADKDNHSNMSEETKVVDDNVNKNNNSNNEEKVQEVFTKESSSSSSSEDEAEVKDQPQTPDDDNVKAAAKEDEAGSKVEEVEETKVDKEEDDKALDSVLEELKDMGESLKVESEVLAEKTSEMAEEAREAKERVEVLEVTEVEAEAQDGMEETSGGGGGNFEEGGGPRRRVVGGKDHLEGGWSPDKKKSKNPEDDEPDPEKRRILEKIRQAADESDDRLINYFIAILAVVIAVFAYYAFVHGGANKPANAL